MGPPHKKIRKEEESVSRSKGGGKGERVVIAVFFVI